MKSKKFIFLPHTADIKFRVYGKSLNEIFENTALSVSDIVSRSRKIKSVKSKKIKLKADNLEALLYGFIDELIYLLDAKNFVVSKAKVKVNKDKFKLEAEILGDSAKKYSDLDHIKAPTYYDMYVKQFRSGKWESQVVVDV